VNVHPIRLFAFAIACSYLGCGLSVIGGTDAGPDVDPDGGTRSGEASIPKSDGAGFADTAPDDSGMDADASADAGADADADADAAPPPTTVGATTVDTLSLTVDCATALDGPISNDGANDGFFAVEVTGPVKALALVRTDAAGTPAGDLWDTWVGLDAIPAGVGPFVMGSSTYQLAIGEGSMVMNDGTGRISLAAGNHSLHVCAASVGSFVTGSYFRVVAQDPQGNLVFGPIVAY
jgi:hypothetical protein